MVICCYSSTKRDGGVVEITPFFTLQKEIIHTDSVILCYNFEDVDFSLVGSFLISMGIKIRGVICSDVDLCCQLKRLSYSGWSCLDFKTQV